MARGGSAGGDDIDQEGGKNGRLTVRAAGRLLRSGAEALRLAEEQVKVTVLFKSRRRLDDRSVIVKRGCV